MAPRPCWIDMDINDIKVWPTRRVGTTIPVVQQHPFEKFARLVEGSGLYCECESPHHQLDRLDGQRLIGTIIGRMQRIVDVTKRLGILSSAIIRQARVTPTPGS